MLRKCRRGFTIIEFFIVVAILAILFAVAIPGFLKARERDLAKVSEGVTQTVVPISFGIEDTIPFGSGQVISIVPSSEYTIGASLAITYRDAEGRLCMKVVTENGKVVKSYRFEDNTNLE